MASTILTAIIGRKQEVAEAADTGAVCKFPFQESGGVILAGVFKIVLDRHGRVAEGDAASALDVPAWCRVVLEDPREAGVKARAVHWELDAAGCDDALLTFAELFGGSAGSEVQRNADAVKVADTFGIARMAFGSPHLRSMPSSSSIVKMPFS